MRFASSLRSPQEAAASAPAAKAPSRTFGLPVWRQGKPYNGGAFTDTERNTREAYEKVTWVFRCVNAIAKRFARVPKVYREGHPELGTTLTAHPLYSLLNVAPANPIAIPDHAGHPDAIARYFWQRVAAQYLLSKKGAFIEVIRRQADNAPMALVMLPPSITTPLPGVGSRFLRGFEVKVPGRDRSVILPPEDVIWVRDPHPVDPYLSQTPLEPLGLTIDSDWWAKVYNRTFLANYGRPGMAIFVRSEISDEDADELKARMTPGPDGAGRSVVVESVTTTTEGSTKSTSPGGGIDVVDFAKTPADLSWLEGRAANKDEILAGFACPESVAIGNASGRTFANADAEYEVFWLDTMPDYAAGILQPFDALDGDPALFLAPDFSAQREFQDVAERRAKIGLEKIDRGGISPDEYRAEYENKGPMPGGATLYLPANRIPLGGALVVPDAPKETAFGPHKVDPGRLAAVKGVRDRHWAAWERTIVAQLRGFFARQERVVLERLSSARALRGTRHWEEKGAKRDHAGKGEKAIDTAYVFERDTWDRHLRELMEPLWREVLADYGQAVIDTLAPREERDADAEDLDEKADAGFDVNDPRVIEFLAERGGKIVGVNDTTRQAIMQAIAEGESAGEGIQAIAQRVRQVFAEASRLRATTIARTELLSASNEGSIAGARQSGVPDLRKVWLATSDDRTRDSHLSADGQTVGLEEPFLVGGAEMQFPGDPAGPAQETINCRCSLLYATDSGVIL